MDEEIEVEIEELPQIHSVDSGESVTLQIPQCCREGWESCPHVVNREEKPVRHNIGL